MYGNQKKIVVPILGGKRAEVRLPTNAELTERIEKQRALRKDLGRGRSKPVPVSDTKADLALYEAIRIDDPRTTELDEAEAAFVISRITYHEATSCEDTGASYRIVIATPFGDTVHVVTHPSLKAIMDYRRVSVDSTDLPYGMEELRFPLGPPVRLYDAVATAVEGYDPSITVKDVVPPHHKQAVVLAMLRAIDEAEEPLDPNS